MNNNEQHVKETLKSMGFDDNQINQAYAASDVKTVEGVIIKIEEIQNNPAQ
jgi:Holliday junction resolvase RusA-like endonuclease